MENTNILNEIYNEEKTISFSVLIKLIHLCFDIIKKRKKPKLLVSDIHYLVDDKIKAF